MARLKVSKVEKGSLPFVPKLLKGRARSRDHSQSSPHHTRWDRYRDSWYPEISALALSLSCLVAMSIVLLHFNGKPNPDIKLGLTLNTIIAILATTSKVALLFTLSNSVGQLKWVWFLGCEARSLLDAEVYDDASRGPLGALLLLWSNPRKSIVSIGAVLTILAIAYDPFVQQIISFEAISLLQSKSDESVVMNAAHSFQVDSSSSNISVITREVVDNAYWGAGLAWKPACPSRDCTWPSFKTLSWHAQCYPDANWTLSNGCSFDISVGVAGWLLGQGQQAINCSAKSTSIFTNFTSYSTVELNADYTVDYWETNTDLSLTVQVSYDRAALTILPTYDVFSNFESIIHNATGTSSTLDLTMPIIAFSAFTLHLQDNLSMTLTVMTCELDLFLDVYNLSAINGIPDTTLVTKSSLVKQFVTVSNQTCGKSTDLNLLQSARSVSAIVDNKIAEVPRLSLSQGGTQGTSCGQDPQYEAISNLVDALGVQLPTEVKYSGDVGYTVANFTAKQNLFSLADLSTGNPYDTTDEAYAWGNKGPEYVMNNLAASITNVMLDPTQNPDGTEPVYGRAEVLTTVVKVTWQWMSLPFGLYIATVCFFLATVYTSKRANAPLWKSSINAFFYHGIDFDTGIWTSLATVREMDAQAAITRARLAPVGITERLMLDTTVLRNE